MRMSRSSRQGCTFFSNTKLRPNMDQNASARLALSRSLTAIARPLLRMCFRGGISIGDLRASLDHAAVREAESYLLASGKKPTYSNISIITGIARHTVRKLLATESDPRPSSDAQIDRATRVINGWLEDPLFVDREGQPKALRLSKGRTSFAALVRRHAGGIGHAAILQRLTETRAVEISGQGDDPASTVVRLIRPAQIFEVASSNRLDQLGQFFGTALEGFDAYLANPGEPSALRPRRVQVVVPIAAAHLARRSLSSALDSSARGIRAAVSANAKAVRPRRGAPREGEDENCVITVALLPSFSAAAKPPRAIERSWRRNQRG